MAKKWPQNIHGSLSEEYGGLLFPSFSFELLYVFSKIPTQGIGYLYNRKIILFEKNQTTPPPICSYTHPTNGPS